MPLHYDREIQVYKVPTSPYGNNGYVVVSPEDGQSIIIDTPPEPNKLLYDAKAFHINLILITHTHFDHLVGFEEIRSSTKAKVGVHHSEANKLPSPPDILLEHDETILFGNHDLHILHTPGHTPGSICVLVGKHLFTGDTLFPGGPGRSGSPEDLRQEIDSITSRLFTLDDEIAVYPGHGDDTTIGQAKKEYQVFASKPHPGGLQGDVLWLSS